MPKNPYTISILLLLLCGLPCLADAQEDTAARAVINRLDQDLSEEELSVLTDRLAYYSKHPIDLNTDCAEQLKELGFISAMQISAFLQHRQQSGWLQNVLELQSIANFDLETVILLLPFVVVKEEKLITNLSRAKLQQQAEQQLLFRYAQTLETQKGFKDLPGSRYLGSPSKLLLRYQYRYADRISFSMLAEKDAGETLFRAKNKYGFDFYSASLGLFKLGRFNKIIIGDYGVQFGQGLSLWTGTAFGRGADVAGVAKNGTGIKAYTSANEAAFFRGLATEIKISHHAAFSTFISYRALDASLTALPNGSYTLSTINVSGLHRTLSEASHQRDLQQLVYGFLGSYHSGQLSIGLAAYHSNYEHTFVTGKPLYRQYYFQGKQLSNASVTYNYTFRNLYFFGETAGSFPGSFATISGIMAPLSPSLSALILYRNYSKKHATFYPQALGDGADAANEKGRYGGLHFSPSKRWDFSVYGDLYFSPWPRYRIDLPSRGSQAMFNVIFTPKKSLKFNLKISTRNTSQNDTSGLVLNPVAAVQKWNLRVGMQWKTKRGFALENRAEFITYHKGQRAVEKGYLVYQDLSYQPLSARLTMNLRLALFSTSSYNSRLYAYEDDVQGGSGSALYNGEGIRAYLNIGYKLTKQLKVWAKYALSYYPSAYTIGSGLDEIDGNKKQDIKVQLRYYF